MSTRLDFSKLALMDALDMASLIEIEATKRYTEFAESLGTRSVDDAGAVFRSMAVNETKHCEEIAERRLALFGDQPARVTLDDIFDVEAPEVGEVRWNMSAFKAYQLALHSEQKAFAFYDEALEYVTHPDVKALFEELRVDRRGVRTDSWETYPVLRFPDVPRIDLILLDRHGAPPLGAGEVTTPPVPAAIANAIDDATGIRLRDLPITLDALRDRVLGMDEGELARVLLG
jgi:rubrerythrin